MSQGSRLQTEVTYTSGSSYPVCISIEAVKARYQFDITERDATNLADSAKLYNCNPDVKFKPIHGMDFLAYWLASDQFEIKGEDISTRTAILFRLDAKQAWTLYDQIMFTRSQALVMRQNGVPNAVSTLGQLGHGLSQETVHVGYKNGAKHPVYFKISIDGQMIQEEITIVDAQQFVNLLEDSRRSNINVCFVSEKNWEYDICWLKDGRLRLAFRDQGFSSQMEITDKTAHDLYEQIKDVLCGPASNMKSKTTEECLDCKGTGKVELFSSTRICNCVRKVK